ncbi:hypothetical protein [Burkholderia gladioli]|uniref:hypothetical protein n=1 Tax=Burkholderia gladioli TaxID=28095 RepID=UPI0016406D11|nr:hypothetical protein [Burkholderia gladioli]
MLPFSQTRLQRSAWVLLAAAALMCLVAYVAALADQACCSLDAFGNAMTRAFDTYYYHGWYADLARFGIWVGAFAICMLVFGAPIARAFRAVITWVSSAR